MADLAGVRFVEAGPVSYCSTGDLALSVGDYVVVSGDRGERLGWPMRLQEAAPVACRLERLVPAALRLCILA